MFQIVYFKNSSLIIEVIKIYTKLIIYSNNFNFFYQLVFKLKT